ncbi:MAG: hypothetical protein KH921_20935, partial [Erysipelotrichaceae bacterium]|nr:hypothetical protein [Erysipelotrichaceae bacterium]
MMHIEQIKEEIVQLLKEANPDCVIPREDEDLFSSFCHIAPRDLVYVLVELKKKYPVNYNPVVAETEVYSLNSLANAINAQIEM